MECEICGHKIPLGGKECPNCGYDLGRNHSYTRMSSYDYKDNVASKRKSKSLSFIIKTVACVIGIFFAAGICIGVIFGIMNIGSADFVEMIENDQDDTFGTIATIIEYENEILSYVEDMDFDEVNIEESKNGDESGYEAKLNIYCTDDMEIEYSVEVTVEEGKCTGYQLNAWGDLDVDLINDNEFPFPKVEEFSNLLGYDSIIKEFQNVRNDCIDEDIDYQSDYITIYEQRDYFADYYIAKKGYDL